MDNFRPTVHLSYNYAQQVFLCSQTLARIDGLNLPILLQQPNNDVTH